MRGWDLLPMEDLDKHRGPQGLHNLLGPPRPKVFPCPYLGREWGHTDPPPGIAHLQCQLTAQFRAPASGEEILRRPGLPKLCTGVA